MAGTIGAGCQVKRRRFLDELMAEPIRMPGCPDLIVTRDQAYVWLRTQGYPTDCRLTRFGSVDYMVFHQPPIDLPLSGDAERERMLAYMAEVETRNA